MVFVHVDVSVSVFLLFLNTSENTQKGENTHQEEKHQEKQDEKHKRYHF